MASAARASCNAGPADRSEILTRESQRRRRYVTTASLEEKIRQAGNPAQMLRNSQMGPYPFPYPAEHSNWRDEQEAWKKTAVLFDQSNHMTDVYFKGPDVKRLLSDTGVNNFTNFGRDKAKQYIAVNYDGYMIGDAVLFGLEEDEVSVVGLSVCGNWMQFHVETGGMMLKSFATK